MQFRSPLMRLSRIFLLPVAVLLGVSFHFVILYASRQDLSATLEPSAFLIRCALSWFGILLFKHSRAEIRGRIAAVTLVCIGIALLAWSCVSIYQFMAFLD